jgi:hypothetical protein
LTSETYRVILFTMHLGDINMSLTSKTKEELMAIIEGQLNDIRLLEAEIDEMWNLLDDIKESESMTSMVLGGRELMTIDDMTAEQIASFFTPIDE